MVWYLVFFQKQKFIPKVFLKLMIQIEDCNPNEVCSRNALKMRKSPRLTQFPFSQDEDHNKQKGEWIHLVLLGMANRCQMGINGPPNVLLQKAFFSAQYFADILSNICIISLRKYF